MHTKFSDLNETNRCINSVRVSYSDKSTTSSKKTNIRIMGRDYPLTLTTYKRLAIGIRIGRDSCHVEITIADSKSNELCFPMSTWKLLLQQEPEILRRFRIDTTPSHQASIIVDHYASTSRKSTIYELSKYRMVVPSYT